MFWISIMLFLNALITAPIHPESSGYMYIAAGLFAIADSLKDLKNKS